VNKYSVAARLPAEGALPNGGNFISVPSEVPRNEPRVAVVTSLCFVQICLGCPVRVGAEGEAAFGRSEEAQQPAEKQFARKSSPI
jgi:hypothetical protein